jgi:hypothetical protein
MFRYLAVLVGLFLYYFLLPEEEDFSTFFNNSTMSTNLTAVVLGGSGTVGKGIVKALARAPQYKKVTLIGRKLLDLPTTEEGSNYQKFEQKLMDFDKIPEHADLFKGHDVAFYGLGVSTTKVTKAEYRRIELDNALALAKHLKDGGCKQLHWVTGQGTKKNLWFLFAKLKVKWKRISQEWDFKEFASTDLPELYLYQHQILQGVAR